MVGQIIIAWIIHEFTGNHKHSHLIRFILIYLDSGQLNQSQIDAQRKRDYEDGLQRQEEQHDAALKIQAAYRGYITRKKNN